MSPTFLFLSSAFGMATQHHQMLDLNLLQLPFQMTAFSHALNYTQQSAVYAEAKSEVMIADIPSVVIVGPIHRLRLVAAPVPAVCGVNSDG
ncbi:hypothetical protein CKAH01_10883 [Colletotrichum kahawae]|uniref:Uncharacterized protein n=1 Tax=Colletotrichum kahawae TaxID=34407 RepID=A0AAD9XW93_COLKA|nr:hypothetical protein CKAH01_10883 [Colletotrichum kahawae]